MGTVRSGRPRTRRVGLLAVQGATLIVAELTEGMVADSDPLPEDNSMVYLNRQWHGLRRLMETAG